MTEIELKSNLHQIVDRIDDGRLLHALYSFLKDREHSQEGQFWRSLSEAQKQEVLQACQEAEREDELIDDEDIWKDLK